MFCYSILQSHFDQFRQKYAIFKKNNNKKINNNQFVKAVTCSVSGNLGNLSHLDSFLYLNTCDSFFGGGTEFSFGLITSQVLEVCLGAVWQLVCRRKSSFLPARPCSPISCLIVHLETARAGFFLQSSPISAQVVCGVLLLLLG